MYIKVRVFPKSKKVSLEKFKEDSFKIYVKEPAEQNLANNAVLREFENYFGLQKGGVKIISGHHSPSKLLSVDFD